MNKWHCYEFMKQVYMRTGQIPGLTEVAEEFPALPAEERSEGVAEFYTTIREEQKPCTR